MHLLQQKHQDTHDHNFTMQFTELHMDLEIFYQIILFITMKPNGCVMKSITKGTKKKD